MFWPHIMTYSIYVLYSHHFHMQIHHIVCSLSSWKKSCCPDGSRRYTSLRNLQHDWMSRDSDSRALSCFPSPATEDKYNAKGWTLSASGESLTAGITQLLLRFGGFFFNTYFERSLIAHLMLCTEQQVYPPLD